MGVVLVKRHSDIQTSVFVCCCINAVSFAPFGGNFGFTMIGLTACSVGAFADPYSYVSLGSSCPQR